MKLQGPQLTRQHQHPAAGRRAAAPAPVRRARRAAPLPPAAASSSSEQPPTQQQAQPPPVYIEDSATAAFLDWARAAGIDFPRLRPASFAGLRGLAAAAPIGADDVIASVPRGAALTLPPKQRCPCPEFVTPEFWDSVPWFAKLAVRLLAEKRKGAASPLARYLEQLPRAVDTPVTWPQARLAQLQYPHLIAQVGRQRDEWRALHKKLTSGGVAAGARAPPEEELFWALAAVRSRTFSGPYVATTLQDRLRLAGLVAFLAVGNILAQGPDAIANTAGAAVAVFIFNILYEVTLSGKLKQYAMCPVVDLANHATAGTVRRAGSFTAFVLALLIAGCLALSCAHRRLLPNRRHHHPKTTLTTTQTTHPNHRTSPQAEVSYDYFRDAFVVAAGRAYAPGQQVFVSYGAQSNDGLMQFYGFAEPGNPNDAYVMQDALKWVAQLQAPDAARLEALERAGLGGALKDVVVTRAGVAPRALQALRFLLARDAGAGPGAFEAPAAGEPDLERRAALALVHACQQELAALGTTLEEDLALAAAGTAGTAASSSGGASRKSGGGGGGGGAVDAAALAFRIEKKRVLTDCIKALTGS